MHIYAGIGDGLNDTSNEFIYGKRYIECFAVLFWIAGVYEFLIMFHGSTLFANKANLLVIMFHIAGLVALLWFKQHASNFRWMLHMFIAFGFVPLAIEQTSGVSQIFNYRRV